MKRIIVILTLLLTWMHVSAQVQPNMTQFMFNPLAYNPAYSGAQGDWVAIAQTRMQWVGADGHEAPKTYVLSTHGLLPNKINGLGVNLVHDDNAFVKQTDVNVSFSHRLVFRNSSISMGLSGGVQNYQVKFGDVLLKNPTDEAFNAGESASTLSPNVGGGIFWYSAKHYVGISAPRLLKSKLGSANATESLNYFFNAGYVLNLGKTSKLKPNMQVRYTRGAPLLIDLNMNMLVFDVLWFGFSYRSLESLDLLLEIHLSESMRLGYSYDLGLNSFSDYNNGSHEFMLSYRFGQEKDVEEKKSYTPRYF